MKMIWAWGLALMGAVAWPALGGTGVPSTAMPDALNGIAPSGTTCRRDEVGGAKGVGQVTETPALGNADLSCAIGAGELQAMRGRGAATLVDVRHAADFDAAHIEGAMNLTLTALRTKAYLRDKPLVLVGNGRGERELYSTCGLMKAQGFRQVRVLRGGLPMWLAQGQSVVGRESLAGAVPRLSSVELWLEGQFDANLVFVTAGQAAVRERLPYVTTISELSPAAVKALLARRAKELKNEPFASVVLVVEPATTAETVNALRAAISPAPLLVYSQAADVFVREMRQQQLTWTAHARGPKQLPCGR